MDIINKVRQTILNHNLIEAEDSILVGFSGGADSSALLHVLSRLRKELNIFVVGAHLNHAMRPSAEDDARNCESFCRSLDVPFITETTDVPRYANEMKVGIESAGRQARYNFFHVSSVKTNCNKIATAHTLDDHVETVLFNLFRGSGLTGLQGIPIRRDKIIRPLRTVYRAETEAYCKEWNIAPLWDSTNDDMTRNRVWIRKTLIPELSTRINVRVKEAIARLSQIAEDSEAILDDAASKLLASCKATGGPDSYEISKYIQYPPFQRINALRKLIHEKGISDNLTHEILEITDNKVCENKPFSIEMPGGGAYLLSTEKDNAHGVFRFAAQSPQTCKEQIVIALPIGKCVHFGRWTLSAEYCALDDYKRAPDSPDVLIDASAINGKLYLRTRRAGDSIQPINSTSTKKLSDIFINTKMPQAERDQYPLVCDEQRIVWLPKFVLDDHYKIDENTELAVRLRITQNQTE